MGGSREGDPAVAFIQTEISCEMYVQVPLHWKFSRRPSFILSPQCSLLVLHRQCCTGRPASLLSFIHSFGLSWLAVNGPSVVSLKIRSALRGRHSTPPASTPLCPLRTSSGGLVHSLAFACWRLQTALVRLNVCGL